jgi:hypothetical protein
VLGSRYALAITGLREENFDLPLAQTRVAIGSSRGRPGDQYISGRVDKACLEVAEPPKKETIQVTTKINLIAQLVSPYAVYVRNRQ